MPEQIIVCIFAAHFYHRDSLFTRPTFWVHFNPSQLHWIHGAKRGDSGFADPNITVRDTVAYGNLYKACETMAQEKFGYKSDRQEYHSGSGKMNIGRHVDGG